MDTVDHDQRLADLERQVTALTAEVRHLRDQAFVLRTLAEVERGGYIPPQRSRAHRPQHLRAVE